MEELLEKIEALGADEKALLQKALGPPVKQEPTAATAQLSSGPPATGSLTSPPRLSQFSGGENKNDVGYKQWIYEVRGLLRGGLYREALVLEAIRRSVRGTAADVLLNMGEQTSVEAVLVKMERVFGNILPPERLLEQFYSAQQKEGEPAAVWACRLEDILSQIRSKKCALVSADGAADMLRTKFFSGLESGNIKTSLRHRFDANASYDELLVAARVAESESAKERTDVKVQQTTATDQTVGTKLDAVLKQLDSMQKRLDEMEKKQKSSFQPRQRKPFAGTCYKCSQQGHRQFECPLNAKQPVARGSGQASAEPAPIQK